MNFLGLEVKVQKCSLIWVQPDGSHPIIRMAIVQYLDWCIEAQLFGRLNYDVADTCSM